MGKLHYLFSLFIDDNLITAIPDSMAGMLKLNNVQAQNNKITQFPRAALEWPKSRTLHLQGNPLDPQSVPDEIIKRYNNWSEEDVRQIMVYTNLGQAHYRGKWQVVNWLKPDCPWVLDELKDNFIKYNYPDI